jgi:hypothetical protein
VRRPEPQPPPPAAGDPARAPVVVEADLSDEPRARERVGPRQALAGAALSVSGVALALVTLLWITDDPSADVAPDGLGTVASSQDSAPEPEPTEAPAAIAATPPAAPPPPPSPAVTTPPSPVVPVTVLNNSRRAGLAARAAATFEAGGWPVAQTGNFRGRIPVTTVYYDPGMEVSAQAFAETFDGVVRVRPRFATLPARGVVVVVTREFAT